MTPEQAQQLLDLLDRIEERLSRFIDESEERGRRIEQEMENLATVVGNIEESVEEVAENTGGGGVPDILTGGGG